MGNLSRSVRYLHTIIRACLEQARKEREIMNNPADSVTLPKDNPKEHRFFDTEQVKIFLKVAHGSHYFPLYYFSLNTGLRRGELLALRWEDIDLAEGTVRVCRGLVRTKDGLVFQEPKSKFSKRIIRMSTDVISILRAYKNEQNNHRLSIGESYQDQGLVFCNVLRLPLYPRAINRHFERL